jgi:hypothetical protein
VYPKAGGDGTSLPERFILENAGRPGVTVAPGDTAWLFSMQTKLYCRVGGLPGWTTQGLVCDAPSTLLATALQYTAGAIAWSGLPLSCGGNPGDPVTFRNDTGPGTIQPIAPGSMLEGSKIYNIKTVGSSLAACSAQMRSGAVNDLPVWLVTGVHGPACRRSASPSRWTTSPLWHTLQAVTAAPSRSNSVSSMPWVSGRRPGTKLLPRSRCSAPVIYPGRSVACTRCRPLQATASQSCQGPW